jgi:transporter family protein
MTAGTGWFAWALWSAVFVALTAIFAKIGLEGVDSDLATLIRTVVILMVLAGFVYFTGKNAATPSTFTPRPGFFWCCPVGINYSGKIILAFDPPWP